MNDNNKRNDNDSAEDEYLPHWGDTLFGECLGFALIVLSTLGGIALILYMY